MVHCVLEAKRDVRSSVSGVRKVESVVGRRVLSGRVRGVREGTRARARSPRFGVVGGI